MKTFLILCTAFILISSCSDHEYCEKIASKYRKSNKEFSSGFFNEKYVETYRIPYFALESSNNRYQLIVETNEAECPKERYFFVNIFFYDINLGEKKIDQMRLTRVTFQSDDFTLLRIDSIDAKYGQKLVINEVTKDNIVKGTF